MIVRAFTQCYLGADVMISTRLHRSLQTVFFLVQISWNVASQAVTTFTCQVCLYRRELVCFDSVAALSGSSAQLILVVPPLTQSTVCRL